MDGTYYKSVYQMYVTYTYPHKIGRKKTEHRKKNKKKRLPSHSKINNRIESTTRKELNVEQKMIIE